MDVAKTECHSTCSYARGRNQHGNIQAAGGRKPQARHFGEAIGAGNFRVDDHEFRDPFPLGDPGEFGPSAVVSPGSV